MRAAPQQIAFRRYGPYALFLTEIAAGGMATLHLGRRLGEAGFARTVAIKRLRHEVASDPKFVAMFVDEARIAARIRHPNVAATVDVFRHEDELCLVLEYVHGESLRALLRSEVAQGSRIAPRIAASILCGALHGLHAAHEAKSEQGSPLGIVHRDVSPPNILVGTDGVARVVDFGIAKAAGRLEKTETGQIKGKFAYMAPEQIDPGRPLDRRTDVFSAGIVLWEMLAGKRLFHDQDEYSIFHNVTSMPVPDLRAFAPGVSEALEKVVRRALERDPDKRFQTAREFSRAIEESVTGGLATASTVGEWVEALAKERLEMLDELLRAIEVALPADEDDALASVRRVIVDDSEKTSVKSAPVSQAKPTLTDAQRTASQAPDPLAMAAPDSAARLAAGDKTEESEPVTTIAVDVTSDDPEPFLVAREVTGKGRDGAGLMEDTGQTRARQQVLASVLARPRASADKEAPPSQEPSAPWTGALFGNDPSDGATIPLNSQGAAADRHPSLKPLDSEIRQLNMRVRQSRRLWALGVLAVLALLIWFTMFHESGPAPTGGGVTPNQTTPP